MYPKGENNGPNKDRKIHRRLQKKYRTNTNAAGGKTEYHR
jgi:hypothetical protein